MGKYKVVLFWGLDYRWSYTLSKGSVPFQSFHTADETGPWHPCEEPFELWGNYLNDL